MRVRRNSSDLIQYKTSQREYEEIQLIFFSIKHHKESTKKFI